MPLSFVGSSKCYTFVKFITLTLYQQNYSMSTEFLYLFVDTARHILRVQLIISFPFYIFVNYFVTNWRNYSSIYY